MENKEISLEDLQENLRQDLKKLTKSQLIEVVIQSQMQVMDLVWSLDNERKDHRRLKQVASSRPLRSVGGVTLP
ncbi:hypothetical protein [Acinetobacter phage ABPH49]|nr:hypothetical protein [Acinetobacter phage ABPH49]